MSRSASRLRIASGTPRAGFAYITDPENWLEYWPGLLRIEPGSRWSQPGDETRLVVKLLGREVELRMTLTAFEDRLVEYTSVQAGLSLTHVTSAISRAWATPSTTGSSSSTSLGTGLRGVYDRVLVRRGVARALRATIENLERELGKRAG